MKTLLMLMLLGLGSVAYTASTDSEQAQLGIRKDYHDGAICDELNKEAGSVEGKSKSDSIEAIRN